MRLCRHHHKMPTSENDEPAIPLGNAILACNPLPTFAIDLAHRVVHWNRACEQLTGIDARDILGTPKHWQAFYRKPRPLLADLLVDRDHAAIERYYEGVPPSRFVSGGYEAGVLPARRGGGRWFHFTVAPLLDAEGKLIGAVETLQDVTVRRRAEKRSARQRGSACTDRRWQLRSDLRARPQSPRDPLEPGLRGPDRHERRRSAGQRPPMEGLYASPAR